MHSSRRLRHTGRGSLHGNRLVQQEENLITLVTPTPHHPIVRNHVFPHLGSPSHLAGEAAVHEGTSPPSSRPFSSGRGEAGAAERLGLHPPGPGKRHAPTPKMSQLCSLLRGNHVAWGFLIPVSLYQEPESGQKRDLMEMTYYRIQCLFSSCLGLRPCTDSAGGQWWRTEATYRWQIGGLGLKLQVTWLLSP